MECFHWRGNTPVSRENGNRFIRSRRRTGPLFLRSDDGSPSGPGVEDSLSVRRLATTSANVSETLDKVALFISVGLLSFIDCNSLRVCDHYLGNTGLLL